MSSGDQTTAIRAIPIPGRAKDSDRGEEKEGRPKGKRRPTVAGKKKTDDGHEKRKDGGCGGRRNPTRSDTISSFMH
jgi:hypothetical protein